MGGAVRKGVRDGGGPLVGVDLEEPRFPGTFRPERGRGLAADEPGRGRNTGRDVHRHYLVDVLAQPYDGVPSPELCSWHRTVPWKVGHRGGLVRRGSRLYFSPMSFSTMKIWISLVYR